jgi:putative SOS response-associated peptidase YedK
MCGRARQVLDWHDLKVRWWQGQPALNVEPRWNAGPRQNLMMIRAHAGDPGLEAVAMNWGFVPSWEKDPRGGRRPINARAESIVAGSGLWRDAFRRRRAIFPVSGFYEWQQTTGAKKPYSIDPADGGVMALASLWDHWPDPASGEAIDSFAVVTCAANATMAAIHDRMPVVIAPADIEAWLSGPAETALGLMKPCADDALRLYPVSPRVGNVRNDGPDLLDPAR